MTDLSRLTYLHGVVREVLRLYPPKLASPRYVKHEFDYAGRHVKPHTTVIFSQYVTHRSAEVFPEPLAFRPQRWDPNDPGYRARRAHEYLPFGAGPHRCIGADLTTTVLTGTLIRVLTRNSLHLPEQQIRPTIRPVMRLRAQSPRRRAALSRPFRLTRRLALQSRSQLSRLVRPRHPKGSDGLLLSFFRAEPWRPPIPPSEQSHGRG